MDSNAIRCDVLVVGGGAAGIRAAIEACDSGCDVLMVSKKAHGYCGSTFYPMSMPWGIVTAGSEEEDKTGLFGEILEASCGCLDKKLTEILVRQSADRFADLCNYGIKFRLLSDSNEKPCFGNRPRGAQLINLDNARECLLGQINQRNIRVLDNLSIFDLMVHENICFGAMGVDEHGQIAAIYSKTVIMAAGGAEYLWKHNVVSPDITGDGYALAARYGARLANMEFIQFIPGILAPVNRLLLHHTTLASLPTLRNSKGQEFLHNYLPQGVTMEDCLVERASHGPFSNEDHSRYFDIAVSMEEQKDADRGVKIEYGDAYYSDKKYELWRNFLLSKGIDTKKTSLIVFPHCQGFNGGILIDENCRSDIENLYACGESAGGPHGANRIGGNAILATQVFGKIAGRQAAAKAKCIRHEKAFNANCISMLKENFDSGVSSRLSPVEVMQNLMNIMQENACILREERKLTDGIEKIEQMEKEYNSYQYMAENRNIKEALDAKNALITARIILYAMLNRKESRGSHYRMDYPNKLDGEFGRMQYVTLNKNRDTKFEKEH